MTDLIHLGTTDDWRAILAHAEAYVVAKQAGIEDTAMVSGLALIHAMQKHDRATKRADHVDVQDLVREFHEIYGQPIRMVPSATIPADEKALRFQLIHEELKELREAMADNDIVESADALADLLYVVYGAAWYLGIPRIDDVVAEVHRSNLTKLDSDGNPIVRSDGKILKGTDYEPPRIGPLIEKMKEEAKRGITTAEV